MKKIIGLILLTSLNSAFAHNDLKKLPLDLTFQEMREKYQEYQRTQENEKSFKSRQRKNPVLTLTIAAGEKLNQWLNLINENREEPLRLTDASTQSQTGIPITKPMKYGPKTIEENYELLEKTMPKELFTIFYGEGAITVNPPVSDKEFILWGRKVSKLYQTTARWNMLSQWLMHYIQQRKTDVRGYYYLNTTQDIDEKIKLIKSLTQKEQDQIKEAVVGICFNDKFTTEADCKEMVNKAYLADELLALKTKYMKIAQKTWDTYFKIENPRKDVVWKKSAPNTMSVIFKDPKNNYIASWLKENIEDEYQWDEASWRLEMSFVKNASGVSYMKFAPNVTPNVSGGNVITMDENASLEEYDVKWTIRHEYGHILRLPDCYTEFYDLQEGVMVNYQLDTSDLMCSRSGHMNERIYEELKRVYMK